MVSQRVFIVLACIGSLAVGSRQAVASISFGDVTEFTSLTAPDLSGGIYPVGGTGISNGGFSIDTNTSGLQIGLRASARFFGLLPNDGVAGGATYVSAPGESPASGSDPTPAAGLAKWNLELHLDQRGLSGTDLADSLILTIDVDPGVGVDSRSIDLFEQLDTFLTLSSMMGADPLLLQTSQNLGFNFWQFPSPIGLSPFSFDPFATGTYDFTLEAFNGTTLLASTDMSVQVVPEPIALFTWAGLALCSGSLFFRRRKEARGILVRLPCSR